MTDAWSHLSEEQHAAAKAAARLLADADMRYVMMLFGSDKAGAILANIEPADGVTLIENALAAAKAAVDIIEVEIKQGRLQ